MNIPAIQSPQINSSGSTLGLTVRTAPFTDVLPGDWAYDAIEFTRKEGVFVGYLDGRFQPQRPLTRREAAALMAKLIRGFTRWGNSSGSRTCFEERDQRPVQPSGKRGASARPEHACIICGESFYTPAASPTADLTT